MKGSAMFQELLERSAAQHRHLCPRQVLGVRMGLLAGKLLDIEVPQADKRMFVFMETDGCGLSGVEAATGCNAGRRTLRVIDYGKMAATFVDSETMTAVRIVPSVQSRVLSAVYVPEAKSRWHCQLEAYQVMPDAELLDAQQVELAVSLQAIISRPGCRVTCEVCGEEIINERVAVQDGVVMCLYCAGDGYYAAATRQSLPAMPVPAALRTG